MLLKFLNVLHMNTAQMIENLTTDSYWFLHIFFCLSIMTKELSNVFFSILYQCWEVWSNIDFGKASDLTQSLYYLNVLHIYLF